MATQLPTLEEMADAGVHFGHRTRQWNPKMKSHIYGTKEGIHIINLETTLKQLETAVEFLKTASKEGKIIVLVGSKRQAAPVVRAIAQEAGVFFITERWPGGLITNFDSISGAITKFAEDSELANNEARLKKLPAKERFALLKEVEKKSKIFAGLVKIPREPELLVVVDPRRERSAVLEARRTNTPTIGIVDTNTDPNAVNYPIIANDDALKSIELILKSLATAIEKPKASK